MLITQRRTIIAATALAVAVGVTAAITVASGQDATPAPVVQATGDGPGTFGVFRRAAGPSDTMPPATRRVLALPAAREGVDLDAARAVAVSAAGTVWAIPGPIQVCLAQPDPTDGFGIGCASIDDALAGRLWTGLNALPGQVAGDVRLAMLVPDGVRTVTAVAADGTGRTVRVADNVAFADLSNSASVQFATASGTTSVRVPGTPAALVTQG